MRSASLFTTSFFVVFAFCAWNSHPSKNSMSSWVKLNGSDGRDINVNETGVFHLVNTAGKLYVYEGPNWKQIGENGGRSCYVENMGLKARIQDNSLWTYERHPFPGTDGRNKWILTWETPESGAIRRDLKDIAIGSDSVFWIIDHRRNIQRWRHYSCVEMPGSDGVRIAAGGGQLWLINTQGEIYRYKDLRNLKIGWEQIPGQKGKDITVTNDGQ
ncbi:MAG TPA: hypothetical protein VMZ03_04205, partial [Chitinophagaceae bacterium]|nr:hypothetical protein [Chitinophagaceae bacterium]